MVKMNINILLQKLRLTKKDWIAFSSVFDFNLCKEAMKCNLWEHISTLCLHSLQLKSRET